MTETETKKISFDIEAEKELVAQLLRGDMQAWTEVKLRVVDAVLRKSTRNGVSYRSIMLDAGLCAEDVFGMLYEIMIVQKKLSIYKFRCPVFYWMRYYVVNLLLEKCKKILDPLSENELSGVSNNEDRREEWEMVEQSFAKLWRTNPMKAYVYFLRQYEGLPTDRIRQMLGITAANTDQLFSRAKRDMLDSLKKEEERTW